MKKRISSLLVALIAFSLGSTKISATEASINANMAGYDAGAFNKTERMQQKSLELENSYIQRIDEVTKDDRIYDASAEERVERDGVLYNPHFLLQKINFEGNTQISTKELESLTQEILGEDIFFDELLEVCAKITSLYHAKGYLTSYATVPPQRIVDGVATIKIIESKVGEVNIDGEKWTREWYLKHIIMGKAGLREGNVFNAKHLQRAMKEINMETYVQVQTDIERKQDGEQETAITLNVRDRFPVQAGFAYDDYGREYTGTQRVSFLLGMHNLTGLGDKIYGGTILSSGSTGWMAGYSLPISPYGTRLSFDFTDSHVRLGGAYRAADIKGNAQSYMFRLTQPLIQNARSDLYFYTGYNLVNANTSYWDSIVNARDYLSDYQLHVWRNGFYGLRDDNYGRWLGNLGLDFGFSGTNKTDITNAGDTTFFKVTANATRVQRLFTKSMGVIRIGGQYSPNKLFAAEQMQLGGPYSIRGYQPAEVIGDYGLYGTVEYRTPIPFLDKLWPWLDDRMKIAAFYDFGFYGINSNVYDIPSHFLHSFGIGTYITLADWITAQVGVSFPLNHDYTKTTARLYFSINSDLDRLIPLRNPEKL